MALKQRKAASEFSGTFPDETVKIWRKMVKNWQKDPSRPNPYASGEHGKLFGVFLNLYLTMTAFLIALKLTEARLRLTQGDITGAERGRHAPHRISASVFIRMGLELEDQQ